MSSHNIDGATSPSITVNSCDAIITIGNKIVPSVKIHLTAVFSILNTFVRRSERNSRVIGALLGTSKDGIVEIFDAYGIPHQEKEEENSVKLNSEYYQAMYQSHRRINKKEVVVGWFATTAPDGAQIINSSSLIHNFFEGECSDPIHIVADTSLAGDSVSIRAFIVRPLNLDNNSFSLATMFHEVRVELVMTESENTCLYHMIRGQENSVGAWKHSKVISSVDNDAGRRSTDAIEKLKVTLDKIQLYIDDIVAGKVEGNSDLGIAISDVLSSLSPYDSDEAANILSEKRQDLLMLSYLTSLIQTQVKISEKINAIL